MFNPKNEFWLRRDCRFYLFFDSTDGSGASFDLEMYASQYPCSQLSKLPTSVIIRGLSGRGVIEAGNERVVIGPTVQVRIPANTPFLMTNELRDTFKTAWVLDGVTGAESFLECLSMTNDENELQRQAAAVGVELYLPIPEPAPVAAIREAENRISWPLGMGFGI